MLVAATLCTLPAVVFAAPACRITVAPGFDFGLYDPDVGATTVRTVTIDCPGKFGNPPPRLVIEGSAANGSRTMVHQANPAEQLEYFLSLGSFSAIDDKGGFAATVHGRIDPGQDPAAGTYADFVTLTFQL